MNAADLIEALRPLLPIITDALAGRLTKPATPAEWVALLANPELLAQAEKLVARFQGEDYTAIASELEAKQAALEGGQPFAALSRDVQAQSMALGNLAVVARGQAVAQQLGKAPIAAFAENILPVVERVLPLLLPLLLAA